MKLGIWLVLVLCIVHVYFVYKMLAIALLHDQVLQGNTKAIFALHIAFSSMLAIVQGCGVASFQV
jgi:hypothetical protein